MKYFFKEEDKVKEKSKILILSDNVEWNDICNSIEDVDDNGEEIDIDVQENKKDENQKDIKDTSNSKKKKKKKK